MRWNSDGKKDDAPAGAPIRSRMAPDEELPNPQRCAQPMNPAGAAHVRICPQIGRLFPPLFDFMVIRTDSDGRIWPDTSSSDIPVGANIVRGTRRAASFEQSGFLKQ